MKIGIACTNALPIPVPRGEIYANQDLAGALADELARQGHDVTLFAPLGSVTRARLVTFDMPAFSEPRVYRQYQAGCSFSDYEHVFLAKVYRYAERAGFDLLHMHLRPLSVAPLAALSRVPSLLTIHDPLTFPYFKMLPLYNEFSQLGFVSISLSQRRALPELRCAANVYNGIDLKKWRFDPAGGEAFCWAGRVIREKAPHRALRLARDLGLRLQLAGFVYEGDRSNPESYFRREVEPLLGGGNSLAYRDTAQLPAFYGASRAFINPLDWEEPFGLVMVEAMACGTPVIAFDRGAVREIVADGLTGFVVRDEAEMREAIRNIGAIRRADCRRHVEERFSLPRMAADYLAAYQQHLGTLR